jgi:hypothetical protein
MLRVADRAAEVAVVVVVDVEDPRSKVDIVRWAKREEESFGFTL